MALVLATRADALENLHVLDSQPTPPPILLEPLRYVRTVSGKVIEERQLQGVPSYLWHHGCAPTAAGMFFGYYDAGAFPYLFPGDASVLLAGNQAFLRNPDTPLTIASEQHYESYSVPRDDYRWPIADRSELGGAHQDNCLADFMKTSFSSEGMNYGSTALVHTISGMVAFARDRHPEATITVQEDLRVSHANASEIFEILKAEIDADRPVFGIVDSDGDGRIDHAIPIWGYTITETGRFITCWDSWYHVPRTFEFLPIQIRRPFGVFNINTLALSFEDQHLLLHRFHHEQEQRYLMVSSEGERIRMQRHYPEWTYLGYVHTVIHETNDQDMVPLHRFVTARGNVLLTANEHERSAIAALPEGLFRYEGTIGWVHGQDQPGLLPVYRLRHAPSGSFIYTVDEAERDAWLTQNGESLTLEGIGWWVGESSLHLPTPEPGTDETGTDETGGP
jgi:hypothetical protein